MNGSLFNSTAMAAAMPSARGSGRLIWHLHDFLGHASLPTCTLVAIVPPRVSGAGELAARELMYAFRACMKCQVLAVHELHAYKQYAAR